MLRKIRESFATLSNQKTADEKDSEQFLRNRSLSFHLSKFIVFQLRTYGMRGIRTHLLLSRFEKALQSCKQESTEYPEYTAEGGESRIRLLTFLVMIDTQIRFISSCK